MKLFIALALMVVWSVFIFYVMNWIPFTDHLHDPLWSLGAAVGLLIGLVGNVWIFFLVMKEDPWLWHTDPKE
ncbi:MAG: hypothetical protein GDA45_05815 [Chromatiales bacterium]|nr:hypothetical protein [Chromatiales bacterium]